MKVTHEYDDDDDDDDDDKGNKTLSHTYIFSTGVYR
jgi:hypothetical protein